LPIYAPDPPARLFLARADLRANSALGRRLVCAATVVVRADRACSAGAFYGAPPGRRLVLGRGEDGPTIAAIG
jgi:hypothetical protein